MSQNEPETTESTGLTAVANRHAATIQWISIAFIVIAFMVLVGTLPVSTGVERLKAWVDGFGMMGSVVFAAVYIGAAMLFVPGSALTLAAGALFGLWAGTAIVSLASTTAAASAFLVARYLARKKVAAQAQRFPRFRAIDEAIGQGGAKIVALLRLSPAVPFSLGNYLFGLTGIRFVPYVLASWLFMLPGTFMYVYFGYAAAQGLEAAGGGQGGKSPAEWAAMVVGLLATVAVTVYVTRLARRAIRAQTSIDEPRSADAGIEERVGPQGWPWGATVAGMLAILFAAGATWAKRNQQALSGLFGPPPAKLTETYDEKPGGSTFDHGMFDQLLHRHVEARGLVDYDGLARDAGELDRYIETLASAPFDDLGRTEKLALLINAYNAFTLRLILDHRPVKSIRDIDGNWTEKRWILAGRHLSLNDLEHEEIRNHFKEPRIHFALVCAAIGCPRLRSEAYVGERLEEQLDDQARYAHSHGRWFVYERAEKVVRLTSLYQWYGDDFRQHSGSLLDFARKYSRELDEDLTAGKSVDVQFLDYDWDLNSKQNAAKISN